MLSLNYVSSQEGLTGSKLDAKMGAGVTLAGGQPPWAMRNLSAASNSKQKTSNGKGPPYDRMAIFDGVTFSPTCCPSTFSNSTGCACADTKMEEYISVLRGGNNTKSCDSV